MKGFVMNDPNVTPPGRGFWRWIKRRTDVLHCPVIVTASPQRTTGDAAKTTTKSRRVQGAKSKWGATKDSFHMWIYEYLVVVFFFFICKPISHNMKTTDRWTGWSHYRTASFESSGSWRSCQSYSGQLNTGAQQGKPQWGKHLSRTHMQPKNLLLASQHHQRHLWHDRSNLFWQHWVQPAPFWAGGFNVMADYYISVLYYLFIQTCSFCFSLAQGGQLSYCCFLIWVD